MRLFLLTNVLLLSALTTTLAKEDDPKSKIKKQERAAAKLPPCQACTALADSFQKGIDRTARGKFEGGDTAWEEKNQGVGYANSEVRFVEIQEELCKDVDRGEQQCHQNHQEWEEDLEEWWRLPDRDSTTIKDWLCIKRLEVCCPKGSYGSKCKECSVRDASGNICSGNGKCKGDGTRKGNGKCSCDKGYVGDLCDSCDVGHYESYKDQDKTLCSACHQSCQTHCTGAGPKSCIDCKSGYIMSPEDGCQDINECTISNPCASNKYCVNREGSYHCNTCHKACKTCHGSGPTNCDSCSDGFYKDGDQCKDRRSDEKGKDFLNVDNTRYFTYFGLCIVTMIVFQRSLSMAAALGVVVAAYVSLSEYFLMNRSR